MANNSFTFVELFGKQLATARHLLDKGAEHVRASVGAGGGDPELMLDWRLVDDMHPLRFQLKVVINFTRNWPARVAGLEPPAEIGDELDLAGFRAAIADAQDFLSTLTPDQFVGRDETPLRQQLGPGMQPTLPAGQWLSGFAATNILFHLSIAYAILRARGVPLGKADVFAGGL